MYCKKLQSTSKVKYNLIYLNEFSHSNPKHLRIVCYYEVMIQCTITTVGEIDTSYNLYENQWHFFYSRTVAFLPAPTFLWLRETLAAYSHREEVVRAGGGRTKRIQGSHPVCVRFVGNISSPPEVRDLKSSKTVVKSTRQDSLWWRSGKNCVLSPVKK